MATIIADDDEKDSAGTNTPPETALPSVPAIISAAPPVDAVAVPLGGATAPPAPSAPWRAQEPGMAPASVPAAAAVDNDAPQPTGGYEPPASAPAPAPATVTEAAGALPNLVQRPLPPIKGAKEDKAGKAGFSSRIAPE